MRLDSQKLSSHFLHVRFEPNLPVRGIAANVRFAISERVKNLPKLSRVLARVCDQDKFCDLRLGATVFKNDRFGHIGFGIGILTFSAHKQG